MILWKVMNKREQAFQTKFNKFAKYKFLPEQRKEGRYNFTFELKHGDNKPLPYKALVEHQRDYLISSKGDGFYYKIPDDSMGHKPLDCFAIGNVDGALVVITYNGKTFYMIDIDEFLKMEINSERKSMTEEEAISSAVYQRTFSSRA